MVVLDNASIHHDIDLPMLNRRFVEHRTMLFYLPADNWRQSLRDSLKLNLIDIVWKYARHH